MEREQKELEEYLQLKEGFIVEEEGVDAEDEETHVSEVYVSSCTCDITCE